MVIITTDEIHHRIKTLDGWLNKTDIQHFLYNSIQLEKEQYKNLLFLMEEQNTSSIHNQINTEYFHQLKNL